MNPTLTAAAARENDIVEILLTLLLALSLVIGFGTVLLTSSGQL